jgi:hypothetical protein
MNCCYDNVINFYYYHRIFMKRHFYKCVYEIVIIRGKFILIFIIMPCHVVKNYVHFASIYNITFSIAQS